MKIMANQDTRSGMLASANEERVSQTVSLVSREATQIIGSAIKKNKGQLSEIRFESNMINSLDGSLKAAIDVYSDKSLVSFSMEVPVKDGRTGLTAAMVESAYAEALAKDSAAPAPASDLATRKMTVDLSKIKATRKGDLVTYTTEELPFWNTFVEASVLKNPINHALVASSIIGLIRGYCLSDYNRVAEFTTMAFSLPVVQELTVQAALKPAEVPGWNVPASDMEVDQSIVLANLQSRGDSAKELPTMEADDKTFEARQRLQARIEPHIVQFVRTKLNGAEIRIQNPMDFSGMKEILGALSGTIKTHVTFYGNDGMEEAWLEIPVDETGKIAADKISKGKLTLEAEQKKAAELKILSEEQARQEFEEWKKKQQGMMAELIKAGHDIKADNDGLGSTFFNQYPVERIPVQRALLPLSANEPGKKIELGGYVYELYPTNYNTMGAIDPAESPFLMLVLRPDIMPGSEVDAHSIYGHMPVGELVR